MSNVSIKFNRSGTIARLETAAKTAIKATAEQALRDSNANAPRDTGKLVESSLIHSNMKDGLLIWSTPGARMLYYGVKMVDPKTGKAGIPITDPVTNKVRFISRKGIRKMKSDRELVYSKRMNPKAGKMWAHRARAEKGDNWNKIMQETFTKEARE